MNNKKAFTFIEMIIAIWILTFIMWNFLSWITNASQRLKLEELKSWSRTNILILNNILSHIIKNSYGISYSWYEDEDEFDKLVLYTDKLEQNTIEIYVKQDLDKDMSRLFILKDWEEIALHSSELFVTNLEFSIPTRDLITQPWVWVNIKARTRSPLEVPTDDKFYDLYNRTTTSLYWRWLIRNYVPSSTNI